MEELTRAQCQQARMARDARFDGRFFVAVKTTGIFCRPICPAMLPKESNVDYYFNAALASAAGFRPCLRCRPDSAPGSWAWRGTQSTVHRALRLIETGALQEQTLPELCERLGVSDRYLRQLFQQQIGMSPKTYAQIQQLMFAKQLLHSSQLTVTDIAIASGFNSVRRFNDAFQKHWQLTPTDLRRQRTTSQSNQLTLAYRPPLNWEHLLAFYRLRQVTGVEQLDDQSYARTLELNQARGWFRVKPGKGHYLTLDFELSDLSQLRPWVATIRRMLDLDADIATIEHHLHQTPLRDILSEGVRIPGVASPWEAGIRAILGQQVSVKAAITQLNRFVTALGENVPGPEGLNRLFPTAQQAAKADLSFLPLPESRRATLHRFADFVSRTPDADINEWLTIKGIGPWTLQYAKLRGLSDPDQFLMGDLIIKKTLNALPPFSPDQLSPWGSYATFHCWNHAS
ncbi:AlkA N-terminal domain-containing protein [Reinekea blandensis]|uniref:Ada regulatory protein n=1 Tax=Reinekea blandensis MED297 TaxID=314283 RepID=A4B9J4_9GAMM|nr:AlkA N-terminal domain-containing protein [Reinekea blandensis]EAR11295.1 ada regulatory protein [Reinekea sp. MED297] [Reinekea blandensis MED297]